MLRGHQIVLLLLIVALIAGCGDIVPTPTPVPSPTVPAPTATTARPTDTPEPPSATPEPPVALAGSWVGGFAIAGGAARDGKVFLDFSDEGGVLSGTARNLPGDTGETLVGVKNEANAVHFEWQAGDASDPLVFDGRASGHSIAGTVRRGASSGDFAFVRLAQMAASKYAGLSGAFQFADGGAVGFYETNDPQAAIFASPLVFADLSSGDLDAIFPIDDSTFAVGSAIGLAYPFRGEVTFAPDGKSIAWRANGGAEKSGSKLAVRAEEMRFQSGAPEFKLAGRLVTPQAQGRVPAVILIHGAGPMTRRNWLYDMLGDFFAAHGIATLSYDKRGAGESEGRFVDSSSETNLQTLAEDALAAAAYLKSRQEIDPAKIGMLGSSQAGWTIPLAASQSADVAFMMMWSGPGVSQGITDLYDHRAETTSREEMTELLRNATPSGFDAIPALEKTNAPGWWAYGGQDMTVPVPESIARLEDLTKRTGKDYSWQVFPTGDHYMLDVPTPDDADLPYARGFVPGLLEAMVKWLEAHVKPA